MPDHLDNTDLQSRTGLFLGAGASYEAGLPLVWDLTAQFRQWLTPEKMLVLNEDWKKQPGYCDAIMKEFMTVLQDPNVHYESLIGYLEVQFLRNQAGSDVYDLLRRWLVHSIYIHLLQRHLENRTYIELGLRFIDGIAGLADRNEPLWIFSLNHDLVVECLAVKHEIPLSAGLSERSVLPRSKNGTKVGELPVEVLTRQDFSQHGLRFLKVGDRGINLLKLHGGLDIYFENDGQDMVRLLPLENTVNGVMESLRVVNEEVFFPHPISGAPVKVPGEIAYEGADNKMQFLRPSLVSGAFKFSDRIQQFIPLDYLSVFRENLRSLQRLICIGYSFGDAHINGVIRDWLEVSGAHRLEIVSPGMKDLPSLVSHLKPQVEVINLSATEYLERYSPNPLTEPEDILREFRQFERERKRKRDGFA